MDHQAAKQREDALQAAPKKEEHPDMPALALNDGQRWKANPETSAAVELLDEHLDIFLLKDEHSAEEYHALGIQMSKDYKDILAATTMTGEGLVQLRNYLEPMEGMIETLKTADVETCRALLEPLHRTLHTYAVYFE